MRINIPGTSKQITYKRKELVLIYEISNEIGWERSLFLFPDGHEQVVYHSQLV